MEKTRRPTDGRIQSGTRHAESAKYSRERKRIKPRVFRFISLFIKHRWTDRSGRGFFVTQGRNALWVCACEGHHHEEYCSDYITSILHHRLLRSRHVRITAIKSLINKRVSIRIIDQLMDQKDDPHTTVIRLGLHNLGKNCNF